MVLFLVVERLFLVLAVGSVWRVVTLIAVRNFQES